MDNEVFEIITRVLSGEASLEDKQRLINWLGQDKANIKIFGEAESLWNAFEIIATRKNYDSKEAFNRFRQQINKKMAEPVQKKLSSTKFDWILRIAAILVVTFGLSYFLVRSFQNNSHPDKSICEVVAPRGSKAKLLLPDGTIVWLNADSKVNYGTDFNKKTRDIFLEGEGYFEIAKNPDKPFIVNTASLRIKALGTTFNVRSYPDENTVEATLIEGKVDLERILGNNEGEKLLTLKPNQKAIYYITNEKTEPDLADNNKKDNVVAPPPDENKTKIVLDEEVNTEISTSWKNDKLSFENETFQDLAVMLERRFDVKIHFLDESIKKYRFSGKLSNIIIDQALSAMQFTSQFYFFINENDIYISDKPLKDKTALDLIKNKPII
jgi:transmembrane sensor